MALVQLGTLESLRYCAPGEWGKLLGLDLAPVVRTKKLVEGEIGSLANPKALPFPLMHYRTLTCEGFQFPPQSFQLPLHLPLAFFPIWLHSMLS